MRVRVCVFVGTYLRLSMCVRACVSTPALSHTRTHIRTHTRTQTCMHAHSHTLIKEHTHTRTHTHTQNKGSLLNKGGAYQQREDALPSTIVFFKIIIKHKDALTHSVYVRKGGAYQQSWEAFLSTLVGFFIITHSDALSLTHEHSVFFLLSHKSNRGRIILPLNSTAQQ